MSYILCRLGRKTGKIIPRMFNMLISRFGIMGDFFGVYISIFSIIKKKTILAMATLVFIKDLITCQAL